MVVGIFVGVILGSGLGLVGVGESGLRPWDC